MGYFLKMPHGTFNTAVHTCGLSPASFQASAFLLGVVGVLAQYERTLARERIMVDLAAAKKRRRRIGRPRVINIK